MWRRLIIVLVYGCVAAGGTCGQEKAARPAADPNKYAVILSGASGDEEFAKRFKGWTEELRGALVGRFGFEEAKVTVLSEVPEGRALKATAEEVRRTFQTLRAS